MSKNTAGATLSKFDYSYDSEGQIQTWTQQLGAASTNTWTLGYDRVDQLLETTVRDSATSALLKQFIYGYDKAGNRTSEQIDMSVTTGTPNDLNQLATQAGAGPVRFKGSLSEPGMVTVGGVAAQMSNNGSNFTASVNTVAGTNHIPVSATDYSHNSRTNTYQIVVTNNAVAKTLNYDLNGNLTSMVTAGATNTYDWDAANRMVRITQITATNALVTSEFTYDGQGRRVRAVEKQNGTLISDDQFFWVGLELAEQRDSTGATVTRRFFGQGEQIAGVNYYFTRDHLGSVCEMTDSNGAVRAQYKYDPYGRRTKVLGDLEADFGFTGHYVHVASGLYLAPYRAYDPESGRWLSRDPIEEDGGLNLYGYVGNNPINGIDPLGLSWTSFAQSAVTSFAVGIISGVIIAGLVAAVAVASPVIALAAAATAVVAVGYGAYSLGINAREAVEGVDPYTGRILSVDEIDAAAGNLVGGLAAGAVDTVWYRSGWEYEFDSGSRIAPFGNRTGNSYGECPHYHRKVPHPNPKKAAKGESAPNQGIRNHRPWQGGF